MMYSFQTLENETEINHSELLPSGRVKVYIETPDAVDCFHHLTVWLPAFEIEEVYRYAEAEVERYLQIVQNNEHAIMHAAEVGAIELASER
ncbi:MAG: hypothetical protein K5705_00545 [Oscillospiraceae bacterium]|nr:hypothetical protein [Oscillospiraceae bacterium]